MWKFRTFLMSPFSGVAAFLTETTNSVSVEDILGILKPITDQFSVSTIVALLAGLLGVALAFVFLWWGVRKGFGIIMRAVQKGRAGI